MKLKILGMDGANKGEIAMPKQFEEKVREDLIKRAVVAIQANNIQPYGANPRAGKRASAMLSKRRRKYRGTYGIGQSRTPRKVMSRSGTRFNYTGAFAPQTVGGRRAHPPKADKIWDQKVNKTENRKAIRSALAASILSLFVKNRGHKIPERYPFIIADEFQEIKRTKELKDALLKLGFQDELKRTSESKFRTGIARLRGRSKKTKKGILFVTASDCNLKKSSANIQGSDFVTVDKINAELLAPGTVPGRLTLYTESAVKKLESKKLFTQNFKGEKVVKEKKSKKTTKKKVLKKDASPKKEKKVTKK